MSRREVPPLIAARDYVIGVSSEDVCVVETYDEPRQIFNRSELDRFIHDLQRARTDMERMAASR